MFKFFQIYRVVHRLQTLWCFMFDGSNDFDRTHVASVHKTLVVELYINNHLLEIAFSITSPHWPTHNEAPRWIQTPYVWKRYIECDVDSAIFYCNPGIWEKWTTHSLQTHVQPPYWQSLQAFDKNRNQIRCIIWRTTYDLIGGDGGGGLPVTKVSVKFIVLYCKTMSCKSDGPVVGLVMIVPCTALVYINQFESEWKTACTRKFMKNWNIDEFMCQSLPVVQHNNSASS